MSIVKDDHNATLRQWHEELQEQRGARVIRREIFERET